MLNVTNPGTRLLLKWRGHKVHLRIYVYAASEFLLAYHAARTTYYSLIHAHNCNTKKVAVKNEISVKNEPGLSY